MADRFSQRRALWAITKASFRAIFRNISSLIFSIIFPIVFILIFGSFGQGVPGRNKIAFLPGTDTTSQLYDSIISNPLIKVISYRTAKGTIDTARMKEDLEKGSLDAKVELKQFMDSSGQPHFIIHYTSTTASGNAIAALKQTFDNLSFKMERQMAGTRFNHFQIIPRIYEVRPYHTIDFILPGQLGFSVLFSTLFGIAFTFFNLRETLVLKRFYASPVNRINILLGIGASRLFFQLVNVIILIGFGYFFLNFTLLNGFVTFLELIIMSVYILFILMGVGLIFSSVAKTDTSIPLLINLFSFPQILLSGTFFSIDVFPKWMQPFCEALPLTQFNNAIRKISFEGAHLTDCWKEVGILGIWALITYIIAVRVFRWE
ncbi:MAG: ABC transporter permease [Chitinophagaceae bacterium]|jgi:ABC-2 type transport system permease protein|nr:ABC transporter permease [Chitinophagaceae bacterium]OQY95931.1 MAG: ABC transporter [Sphingobacteriales bacterium UTBCD1]